MCLNIMKLIIYEVCVDVNYRVTSKSYLMNISFHIFSTELPHLLCAISEKGVIQYSFVFKKTITEIYFVAQFNYEKQPHVFMPLPVMSINIGLFKILDMSVFDYENIITLILPIHRKVST